MPSKEIYPQTVLNTCNHSGSSQSIFVPTCGDVCCLLDIAV